ncbi:MAG: hypothetical protein HYV97_01100 [Bdellovibrio sp.]|nr:hypothetical protein [Bdellovibrio sp.]
MWTKESYSTAQAIREIETNLPFYLHGFASDNGTEFLNEDLLNYLTKRAVPVEFVRRRPYQKNDNAYVEQKNWTHVRELFGYERITDKAVVSLMNEIYRTFWNPLQNYFIPCLKIKAKHRIGGKIKKNYVAAKTPYTRLLESKKLRFEQEEKLRREYDSLNPFKLRKIMDEKLGQFYRILDSSKKRVS